MISVSNEFETAQMTIPAKTFSTEVRVHDFFNIIALFFFGAGDLLYLYQATDWTKFGTSELGADHIPLFSCVMLAFAAYLIIDSFWIILVPKCVQANPTVLIIHHVGCLSFMILAFLDKKWSWHAMVILLAEINTLFLTLRRNVKMGTYLFTVTNILFYITWFLIRIFIWTALALYFLYEYELLSKKKGTYFHFWVFGPVLQVIFPHFGVISLNSLFCS